MRTRDRGVARLALACALALGAPASAAAVTPASVTGPTSVAEGVGTVEYTIACGTMDVPVVGEVAATGRIAYTTVAGTATEGSDYEKAASGPDGEVNCAPGPKESATTQKVTVKVTNDLVDESAEKYSLTISAGTPGFAGTIPAAPADSASTTIVDDDVPIVAIAPLVQILEGDSGTALATLVVTLSQAPADAVTVPYSTQAESALAGSDFVAMDASIEIPAGQTTGTISIPIVGDTVSERPEAFYVNLGTPTNAVLGSTGTQGGVAIFDNDPPPLPAFSLGDNARVREGDSGTVNALFTVTLSRASEQRTRVSWRTAPWTATRADYRAAKGVLELAPGQTSKTISVEVKGDRLPEPKEVFAVLIESPEGATIAKKSALGIIDDDDQPAGPMVDVSSPKVEGRTIAVMLKCPASAAGCTGEITARAGKLKLGRASFELAKAGEADVALKLSRKARRLLRKRRVRVRFTVVARDGAGPAGTTRKSFMLGHARKRL
jgi:hypothetical protein